MVKSRNRESGERERYTDQVSINLRFLGIVLTGYLEPIFGGGGFLKTFFVSADLI